MVQHAHNVYDQLIKIFTELSFLRRRIHKSKHKSQTFNHDDDDGDLVLNDDVRIIIMSRLPLKSLLKLRSVSKSWRQSVDSPLFRELYVQNQLSNDDDDINTVFLRFSNITFGSFWKLSIVLPDTGNSYGDFPAYRDFLENNIGGSGNLGFSGSVHGLICLYKKYSTNPIALCNPSLQEIKILPPSPFQSSCVRLVELGYDDVKKDFKIVQLLTKPRLSIAVEVFSRKENTWRLLEKHPLCEGYIIEKPIQRLLPPSGGAAAAAVARWIGQKRSGFGRLDSVIVSFDMRSEAFDTIKIPFVKDSNEVEIFAKDDSFIVFVWDKFWRSGVVRIWEYKRKWIKVGRLGPLDERVQVVPVAFWKSDGLVLETYSKGSYTRRRWKVISYDCCSRKIIRFIELPGLKTLKGEGYSKIVEYRGSLISP